MPAENTRSGLTHPVEKKNKGEEEELAESRKMGQKLNATPFLYASGLHVCVCV